MLGPGQPQRVWDVPVAVGKKMSKEGGDGRKGRQKGGAAATVTHRVPLMLRLALPVQIIGMMAKQGD